MGFVELKDNIALWDGLGGNWSQKRGRQTERGSEMWEDTGDHLTVKYWDTLSRIGHCRYPPVGGQKTSGGSLGQVQQRVTDNRRGQSTPDICIPNIIRTITE